MSAAALTIEGLRARHGEKRYRWLLIATIMIGMVTSIMCSTIINVAIPDMTRFFVIGQERAQWVSAGFMVSMTLSMLLTPWMLSRFGLRRTYIGSVVLLGVAGVIGGLSSDFNMLVAMRAAQGIAGGIMQPLPSIVIVRSFPRAEQGGAMGLFGLGVVLAPAMGPTVGGVLVEHFGWRAIFFVVVPFCILAILAGRKLLPTGRTTGGTQQPLDWAGLTLMAIASITFLNGLVELRSGSHAWILIACGVAAYAAFVQVQLRVRHPMLQMRIAMYRRVGMAAIIQFLYGFGLLGSTYLMPLFFQEALGYSPSASGLITLPSGIALALTIPLTGRVLVDRVAYWRLIATGITTLAVFTAAMAFMEPSTPVVVPVLCVMLARIGMGLVSTPLALGSVQGLPPDEVSHAVSMTSFARQLGGAMGVSIVGVALQWRLESYGVNLADPTISAARKADAFDQLFIGLGCIVLLAVIAAWNMRSRRGVSIPGAPVVTQAGPSGVSPTSLPAADSRVPRAEPPLAARGDAASPLPGRAEP